MKSNREIGREWGEREAEIARDQGRRVDGAWTSSDADALPLVDDAPWFFGVDWRNDAAEEINVAARERWGELVATETAAVDYDARIESALAWCEKHRDLVHAGGLTIAQAAGELLAGRLYDVDTGSAGHDCVIDADSEDEALELVGEHAGLVMNADELRAKFDPWTAKLVTI